MSELYADLTFALTTDTGDDHSTLIVACWIFDSISSNSLQLRKNVFSTSEECVDRSGNGPVRMIGCRRTTYLAISLNISGGGEQLLNRYFFEALSSSQTVRKYQAALGVVRRHLLAMSRQISTFWVLELARGVKNLTDISTDSIVSPNGCHHLGKVVELGYGP